MYIYIYETAFLLISKLQNWCNAGQGHWQNMFPLTKRDKLLAISNTVIQQQ